ncbi:MAG: AAA family ATPase [bacterium]|nr:AAA family ATPase [bacterium]
MSVEKPCNSFISHSQGHFNVRRSPHNDGLGLGGLLKLLHGGDPCVRLAGSAGIGKTLLLRRVAQELGDSWRCVYLPYPKLEPEELWVWIAEELGARGTAKEAVARVAARAHDRGGALLVMVDDAHLQPPETRRSLAKACALQAGLRLLLCETAELPANEGEGAPGEIWLTEPLSPTEAREYLRERLRLGGASSEMFALFDDAAIAELHREAGGSLAALHSLATALIRRQASTRRAETSMASEPAPNPPAEVAPKPRTEAMAADAPSAEAGSAPDEVADSPRRPMTDREAIAELAANLPSTYRRPAPGPELVTPERQQAAAESPRSSRPALGNPDLDRASSVPAAEGPLREPVAGRLPRPEPGWIAALREALSDDRARWVALGLLGGLLLGFSGSLLAVVWLTPGETPSEIVETPPSSVPASIDVAAPAPATDSVVALPEVSDRMGIAVGVATEGPPEPRIEETLPPRNEERTSIDSPVVVTPVLGRMNVNAIPWANIEIDGEPAGETPLGELAVPRGSRQIVARFPDGQVTTRTVELGEDEIFLVLRPDER